MKLSWTFAFLCALIALSGSPRADADVWSIEIIPGHPAIVQPVYARISVTAPCVFSLGISSLRQEGSTIQIVAHPVSSCTIPPLPGPCCSQDVSLGSFGAGSFSVVLKDSSGAQLTSGSFTVDDTYASKTAPFPLVDYSDHWWNPQESGWGMSIVQHPSGEVFVVWFVYNSAGVPTWYVIPSGKWETLARYTGTVYKTTGPFFGSSFDPNRVGVTPAGNATLSFTGYATANFSYTVDGITGTKAITRLPF